MARRSLGPVGVIDWREDAGGNGLRRCGGCGSPESRFLAVFTAVCVFDSGCWSCVPVHQPHAVSSRTAHWAQAIRSSSAPCGCTRMPKDVPFHAAPRP